MNDVLFTKELCPSLSFLIVSAYKAQIINKETLLRLIQKLTGYPKLVVYYKIEELRDASVLNKEWDFLINNNFDRTYFEENLINAVYCRIFIKKLLANIELAKDNFQIVVKNLMNIEYEHVPHFISVFYDM